MKTFALIGAAGYVAERHLAAIKDVGGDLVAAMDYHDSVGILDHYFPKAEFFTGYRSLCEFLVDRRERGCPVNYVSICSPNYCHYEHCDMSLWVGADVICEKPLVLNPNEIDRLKKAQQNNGGLIHPVLQLRYHPDLIELKKSLYPTLLGIPITSDLTRKRVEIYYVTPRGPWYHKSWKGSTEKSGGIITNIGIHLFDMVIWIFGPVKSYKVHYRNQIKAEGTIEFERATVNWFLSIDASDSRSAHRSITVDDKMISFDNVFTELHTEVYQNIIDGKGFDIEDARPSIELVYKLRNAQ